MIRKDERSEKDFQRDILRDANERDTREQERRICSFGSGKKALVPKSGST